MNTINTPINQKIPPITVLCLQCGTGFQAKSVFGDNVSTTLYEDFCSDDCIDAYNLENPNEWVCKNTNELNLVNEN